MTASVLSKTDLQDATKSLTTVLGLETEPVAVFLLHTSEDEKLCGSWEKLSQHRFCQAVMKARHGLRVVLTPDQCACPAARHAFGFRPLPVGLASGKGLKGFGIVENPRVGKVMFEHMPKMDPGEIRGIALSPLAKAHKSPDVVIIEGRPEQLMWLLLADLNLNGGTRRQANTAVLQATCVDSTVIPYKEHRFNFSLGCYGCRDATDLDPAETVLGFHGELLLPIVDSLHFLSEKAIPQSRSKGAYRRLMRKRAPERKEILEK